MKRGAGSATPAGIASARGMECDLIDRTFSLGEL